MSMIKNIYHNMIKPFSFSSPQRQFYQKAVAPPQVKLSIGPLIFPCYSFPRIIQALLKAVRASQCNLLVNLVQKVLNTQIWKLSCYEGKLDYWYFTSYNIYIVTLNHVKELTSPIYLRKY